MSDYRKYRQRQFGATIAALRTTAGMSGRRLAETVGVDQSRISRIENGMSLPTHEQLDRILTALNADDPDTRESLGTELVSLDVSASSWRWIEQRHHRQSAIAGKEHAATHRRGYHLAVVPGLLQTPAYAQAVLQSSPTVKPHDVDEAVTARIDRQHILIETSRRFDFLITGYALRRPIGSTDIRSAQIEHITELSQHDTINVLIIADQAKCPVVTHDFTIFDETQVYIDTVTAGFSLTQPQEIADYMRLYDELRATALTAEQSREHLHHLISRTAPS